MPFLNLVSSMELTNGAGPRLYQDFTGSSLDWGLTSVSVVAQSLHVRTAYEWDCTSLVAELNISIASFPGICHFWYLINSSCRYCQWCLSWSFLLPTHDFSGSDQVDEGLEMIVPDIFFHFQYNTQNHSSATVIIKQSQLQVKKCHYRRFNNMMMGQWPWGRSTSIITLTCRPCFPFFITKHFSWNSARQYSYCCGTFIQTILSFSSLFVFRLLAIVF